MNHQVILDQYYGECRMNLSKYLTQEKNEVSVLKNVPIEHLKEVQTKVGSMIKVMNYYSSICKTQVRYEYRGPRRKISEALSFKKASSLKADAETVSVYFNVQTTCPGLSKEVRTIFRQTLKKNFSEIV